MREILCEKLAYKWREAENIYLDSDYINYDKKSKVLALQNRCKLTKEEVKLVEDIASSLGV